MRWSKRFAAALLVLSSVAYASTSNAPTPFVHKKKYAMGTVFEVVAYDRSAAHASLAIDKAFNEIVRLDELMSNYKPDSELSHLNQSAHFRAERVSPDLYQVIEQSLEDSRLSGGKFDITVGPLVDLWKAAMRGSAAPSAKQVAEARSCVGYDKIELLPPDRVQFRSSCLRLDVGGIGKGYAVDRAVAILRSYAISSALINAGGSTIYAMGSPPGQSAWLVHMRDPSRRVDPQVMLSDASLSTSEQTPPSLLEKSSAGHIIDPASGMPFETRFAVSVVTKSATESDALSTALLLVGPREGKRIVQNLAGTAAIWVAPDGELELASSGPEIIVRHQLQSICRTQGEPGGAGCK